MRSSNDNESRRLQERRKRAQNILAALWVGVLVVGGYHLVVAFMKNQREQECFARGYRTCAERDLKQEAARDRKHP